METIQVYLDTDMLIGNLEWLVKKGYHKENKFSLFSNLFKTEREKPFQMLFFKEHKEIKKYISLLSVAEVIGVLIHGKDFLKYSLTKNDAYKLIQILQNVMSFEIIIHFDIEGKKIDGNMFTSKIIDYVVSHEHIQDCIHVDIAKINELIFVTDEKKVGKLKTHYEKIDTFNHFKDKFN